LLMCQRHNGEGVRRCGGSRAVWMPGDAAGLAVARGPRTGVRRVANIPPPGPAHRVPVRRADG